MNVPLGAPEMKGPLETKSAALLLAEAWRDRRSGCLHLRLDERECRIPIANGAPTGFESDRNDDGFAQSLEDAGLIRAVDRLKVEKFAEERSCPQAHAVHALGLIDAKTLYQAMRESNRRRISELFEWRRGEFVWEPADPETKPAKPFDILKMIQQQLPQRWGVERLFEELLPHSGLVCDLVPNLRRVASRLGKNGPMPQRMLEGIDGTTSIGRLLGQAAGDPLAASTLWVLVHAGLVRHRGARGESIPPSEIEFEVLVESEHEASHEQGTPSGRKPATTIDKSARGRDVRSAKADKIREEVASLLSVLNEIDHYEILALAANAGAADIKKAYFKAAKKYHPDALGQLGLNDIKEDAAQVFARIAEAFETLSDADKRAAYDRGDSEPTELDTARLTQAETSYRKGEILLRMGNFAGALEYLEPAVELWPEEPAYQAALGWALFKQPRSDSERARTHLRQANDQAPEDAVTLFRLGLVLRSLGEEEASADCILRARNLDPGAAD